MTDRKPLADKWASRDFPILVEVTRRIDDGDHFVSEVEIAESIDMPGDDVRRGIQALERRGLITTTATMTHISVDDVAGQAYLMTGLHPDADDEAERLASLLRQAADQTNDPEQKSRLRKAASAVGDLVGEVGAGVMTAYATSFLPGQ
jgi:hypothetical protein